MMCAIPADDGVLLDERDFQLQLGGLHRSTFAARAAADDDDVEIFLLCHIVLYGLTALDDFLKLTYGKLEKVQGASSDLP